MPADDAKVASAAREFVKALADLDEHGGDHAMIVDKRRRELEAAVKSEADAPAEEVAA